MTDALSDLFQRNTISESEHTSDSAGESALSIFMQEAERPVESMHRQIATLRKYVPDKVTNSTQFTAVRASIDSQEKALCVLRRRQAMLGLVSKEMQRDVRPCSSLHAQTDQITCQLKCLLKDMLLYRCADNMVDVREAVFPNQHYYHTRDYPLFLTLSILTSLYYYRELAKGHIRCICMAAPKGLVSIEDILTAIDVVPTLAFPVDEAHRRHLKSQCDSIAQLVHTYHDSGPSEWLRDSFMRSFIVINDLRLGDIA